MNRSKMILEWALQLLIVYSIGMHFFELEFTNSDRSGGLFLWSERIVASIFTLEYVIRWRVSGSTMYPLTAAALIDLAAILPFYVGFFVDLRSLRLIRTLRVLRLLKLYRHNLALHKLVNAFRRIHYEFSIIGFALFFLVWFSSIAIYEFEREVQPEMFGKVTDAIWFVLATVTTVGYGDKVPITSGGRIVTVIMMFGGLAIFGTFVSLIGTSLLEEIRGSVLPKSKAMDGSHFCPVCGSDLHSHEEESRIAA